MLWLRSAFFALVLPGSVLLWVPLWISTQSGGTFEVGAARWIGLPVLIVGVAGLLWCIWDFGRRGKGTLAPIDPPRFVVRTGPYRVVRNPMYLAVVADIIGQGLVLGQRVLLGYAAAVWLTVASFVRWYEEPTLARQFGAQYQAYRRAVPAWRPRIRPWHQDQPE